MVEPSGNATEDTAAAGSGLPALGSADLSTKHEEEPEKFKNRRGDDFSKIDKKLALDMMREEMLESADSLDFERAAKLRDEIAKIEKELINVF